MRRPTALPDARLPVYPPPTVPPEPPFVPAPLDDFHAARARLHGAVHRTPLESATLLGRRCGTTLYLKCENLQKTGSFKVRGALNKLLRLAQPARAEGVVTVSAGNFAQALAWAAREAGTPCSVVMPQTASRAKVEASRAYGAEVVLRGDVFEAFEHARLLERERGLTFVHPFDDEDIIQGHGGIGFEILEQLEAVSVVVVPVGGGGVLSGVAGVVKRLRPDVRLYGVEPDGAPAMRRSLDAGRPVTLETVSTIADGLAAPMAGAITFGYVRDFVDDVVTVSDAAIAEAMGLLLGRAKLLTEPAGAAGLAALLAGRIPVEESDRVVLVLTGGNVSLDRVAELLAPSRRPD